MVGTDVVLAPNVVLTPGLSQGCRGERLQDKVEAQLSGIKHAPPPTARDPCCWQGRGNPRQPPQPLRYGLVAWQ